MPATEEQIPPKLPFANEARITQNPALGAVLLWRFTCSYQKSHKNRAAVPLSLVFTVLPIILHKPLFDVLASTQKDSGLRKFTEKFSGTREARQDVLLSIHERCRKWSDVTWDSLRIGFATKLFVLTTESQILPLTETSPRNVPTNTAAMLRNAEKLGSWFAALSIHEISTLLKIRF